MRKNSNKNASVNSEVQRALADIIRSDLKDPRIGTLVSVVSVEVTPDLKVCKAYISVLDPREDAVENTLKGLKSATGFIRRELAAKCNLRNTPELHFVMDQSIEYGVNMSKKIEEVLHGDDKRSSDL